MLPGMEQALLAFSCVPLTALGIQEYRREGSRKQSQNSVHLSWAEKFMEAVAMETWIVLFGNRESCLQSSLNRFHTF